MLFNRNKYSFWMRNNDRIVTIYIIEPQNILLRKILKIMDMQLVKVYGPILEYDDKITYFQLIHSKSIPRLIDIYQKDHSNCNRYDLLNCFIMCADLHGTSLYKVFRSTTENSMLHKLQKKKHNILIAPIDNYTHMQIYNVAYDKTDEELYIMCDLNGDNQ